MQPPASEPDVEAVQEGRREGIGQRIAGEVVDFSLHAAGLAIGDAVQGRMGAVGEDEVAVRLEGARRQADVVQSGKMSRPRRRI